MASGRDEIHRLILAVLDEIGQVSAEALGATAYMLQQVIEGQGGYAWLDCKPRTVTAAAHRTPYGSDGDYFCKPNRDDVFDAVYDLMHEAAPRRFPPFANSSPSRRRRTSARLSSTRSGASRRT